MRALSERYCVVVLFVGMLAAFVAKSNAAKPSVGQKPVQSAVSESQLLKVTIGTSRPEVTGNGTYGIFADLENVSSAPVKLYPTETSMVMQPEVAGDPNCVFSRDAYFPTELPSSKDLPQGGAIILRPKERYAVFWDVSKSTTANCETQPVDPRVAPGTTASMPQGIESMFIKLRKKTAEKLSFVPGDYVFVVDGKAHWMPDGVEESGYHTFTERVKIHVGLSQIDTMFAAMIGGIIGYLVAALREGGDLRQAPSSDGRKRLTRALVILRNLFSAALISAVVTIIFSRISDTQFPIKVSVNDFWGALTIGFVAYFVGNKLIDRIVGLASNIKGSGTQPGNQPAQGAPPAQPKI